VRERNPLATLGGYALVSFVLVSALLWLLGLLLN